MRKRKGFTLIELIVAMAIFFILIYMAFASFTYILAFSQYNRQRANVQDNIQTVLDQITKEVRQTLSNDINCSGMTISAPEVDYPTYDVCGPQMSERNLSTISTPDEPLGGAQYLQFGSSDTDTYDDPLNPILQFYIIDNNGVKHRISYTLGVPTDGHGYYPPHYKGIPKRYWPSKEYEPCEILYSNETWDSTTSTWTGIQDQPVTEQVITNFTVIRPAWSNKVVQIIIEGMVKSPTRSGYEKIRLISQITLRE